MSENQRYLGDRTTELGLHLELLRSLDERSREVFAEHDPLRVEVRQIMILKSSVLVHMYNIVESTIGRLLEEVEEKVGRHHPKEYSDSIFDIWVKGSVSIGTELNVGNLRAKVASMGRSLLEHEAHAPLTIKKTDGNWDERRIEKMADSLGVPITLTGVLKTLVREPVLNDELTRLQLIKLRRNQLAHGLLTFEEGANSLTVLDLEEMAGVTIRYMWEILKSFEHFVDNEDYLRPIIVDAV